MRNVSIAPITVIAVEKCDFLRKTPKLLDKYKCIAGVAWEKKLKRMDANHFEVCILIF